LPAQYKTLALEKNDFDEYNMVIVQDEDAEEGNEAKQDWLIDDDIFLKLDVTNLVYKIKTEQFEENIMNGFSVFFFYKFGQDSDHDGSNGHLNRHFFFFFDMLGIQGIHTIRTSGNIPGISTNLIRALLR
jgi:hypothetical protein